MLGQAALPGSGGTSAQRDKIARLSRTTALVRLHVVGRAFLLAQLVLQTPRARTRNPSLGVMRQNRTNPLLAPQESNWCRVRLVPNQDATHCYSRALGCRAVCQLVTARLLGLSADGQRLRVGPLVIGKKELPQR